MSFSNSQKQSAKNKFEKMTADISSADIKKAINKGSQKMGKLAENMPSILSSMWGDLTLMFSLIKDYYAGNYTCVPWKVIASVTAALLYFISPIDVIPDFIPVIGYLDDLYVIKLAFDFSQEDLEKYRDWKAQQKR